MSAITEITLVGGERLQVQGDTTEIEGQILAAARGSILEFAWMAEASSGQRIGVNPDQVLMLRTLSQAPDADGASARTVDT